MTILLTSVEMNKAVDLWLGHQGFSLDSYEKTTKILPGRTDSGPGTRVEVTLEPRITTVIPEGPITRSPFHMED